MACGKQRENPNQPDSSMKLVEKRICVHCGHITSDRLELLSLSCCPDSWYMPLKEYNHQKKSCKMFKNL
jgi:hypothetical protein